jgi:hypothetical protein
LIVFQDHANINKLLEDELQDKVVIALCTSTGESKKIIELFDTSTEEDINVNNKLSEIIVTQLLLPSLPQVRDVFFSFKTTIFVIFFFRI